MTDKLDYGQTADFPHFTAAPSGWAPRNFQLARAEAPERADKFLLILALGGAAAETHLSWVVMATAEMTRGCRIFFSTSVTSGRSCCAFNFCQLDIALIHSLARPSVSVVATEEMMPSPYSIGLGLPIQTQLSSSDPDFCLNA